jgi:uncharacterized protein
VVRRILEAVQSRGTTPGAPAGNTPVSDLIGNSAMLRSLKPADFTDERFGLPTVTDILGELEKPGRDPRPAFTTAVFAEGVESLADLKPGMTLEGVVTNVAAFGAFVDVGVHQDGLVHVSAMSKGFVSDPREVAKPGDIVKVKVLGVDIPRKRISLTMRLDEPGAGSGGPGGRSGDSRPRPERQPADSDRRQRNDRGGQRGDKGSGGRKNGGRTQGNRQPEPEGAMAAALRRAGLAGSAGGSGESSPRGGSAGPADQGKRDRKKK